jgi:hypothetical protein
MGQAGRKEAARRVEKRREPRGREFRRGRQLNFCVPTLAARKPRLTALLGAPCPRPGFAHLLSPARVIGLRRCRQKARKQSMIPAADSWRARSIAAAYASCDQELITAAAGARAEARALPLRRL